MEHARLLRHLQHNFLTSIRPTTTKIYEFLLHRVYIRWECACLSFIGSFVVFQKKYHRTTLERARAYLFVRILCYIWSVCLWTNMSSMLDTSSVSAVMFTGVTNNNHNNTSSMTNLSTTTTSTASLNSNGRHYGADAVSDQIVNNASLLTGLKLNSSKEKMDETDDDIQQPQLTPVEDLRTANQKSLTELLLTVTLHLSSASTIADPDNNMRHEPSLHLQRQQQRTDLVRVILIPITGLQQREAEMIQTARALQIPISRWNGSLLYTLYQQQMLEKGKTDETTTGESRRITLHLYQDSNMKWSTTNDDSINKNEGNSAATTAGLSSSSSSIWFGTCLNKNTDLDWIQSYYVTGRLSIPSNARGYDVL